MEREARELLGGHNLCLISGLDSPMKEKVYDRLLTIVIQDK